MASISSLSSINGLNLWLDATDLSTLTITPGGADVRQWTDKSSNAYEFIPIRPTDPPKLSTNGTSSLAVLFDLVSSFQLVSRKQIPVNSTLDFFAVLIPYSLWGPRAPIFDSADITVAETDTRFNTQIYADGNEFYRSLTAPGFSYVAPTYGIISGAAIYQGDLYVGNNGNTSFNGTLNLNTNNLIQFNRKNHNFELFPKPLRSAFTRSLAVYDGKLFVAGSNTWDYYSPSTNTFISTAISILPNTCAMTVYRRNLFAIPQNTWENFYQQNSVSVYPAGYRNALFQFSTGINAFSTVVSMASNFCNANWNTDVTTNGCNLLVFKDSLYINTQNNTYGSQLFRYNGTFFNNTHNLGGGGVGYITSYWGSLLLAYNSQRLYKFNDTGTIQNFGRLAYGMFNGNNGISGNAVTYKGNLWIQRTGSVPNTNVTAIEIFQGERGGTYGNAFVNPFISAQSFVTPNSSNMMIVHDGKIFFCGNTFNFIYEYGNGTSVDQSYSTLTSAAVLLQIRKSPGVCQMYLNGTLVETQVTNFTYSNQQQREMWVGGGAGLMNSGQSDCGSDHFQGAIQAIAQYNQILSTSDRQKVEGILAWTYGIQNVLPASHPYRNSRP